MFLWVHGEPSFVFRMHWDHEPDWHPSPCPLPARRGEGGRRPGEGRFMESEHLQNSDVSWGHEPGLRKSLDCRQITFRFMESSHGFQPLIGAMNIPLTRPSGTLSPSEGERDGVRGLVHGKLPFVFRMYWD